MSSIQEDVIETLLSVGVVAGDDFENNVRALCNVFHRTRKGEPYPDDVKLEKMTLAQGIRFLTDKACLKITLRKNGDKLLWEFKLIEDMEAAKERLLRSGANIEEEEIAPRVIGTAIGMEDVEMGDEQRRLNDLVLDVQFVEAINALIRQKENVYLLEAEDVREED